MSEIERLRDENEALRMRVAVAETALAGVAVKIEAMRDRIAFVEREYDAALTRARREEDRTWNSSPLK